MDNQEIKIIKEQDKILNEIDVKIDVFASSILNLNSEFDKLEQYTKHQNDLINSVNEFQANPQLLDKWLPKLFGKLLDIYLQLMRASQFDKLKSVSEIVYNFNKVRGIKVITNFFSTDIYIFPNLLSRLLQLVENGKQEWYETSFLLQWCSVLILSPFKLDTLISKETIYYISFEKLMMEKDANSYLNDMNVLLYSKFLSRVDSEKYLLDYYAFIDQKFETLSSNQVLSNLKIMFNLLKMLRYPQNKRKALLDCHYNCLVKEFTKYDDYYSVINLKFLIKNFAQLSIKFINFVNENYENDDINEEYYLERVEETISIFISLSSNKSSVIRYCVAKNLSKIIQLLPKQFQLEVIDYLFVQLDLNDISGYINQTENNFINLDFTLNIDFDLLSMNQYHGFLVTIAELFKRKLIPANDRYLNLIYVFLKDFLHFQRSQVNSSVTGSTVRDATLYIIWNFLKYNGSLVKANHRILVRLFKHLVLMVCFDGDLLIRRASSAVLQELIGRYGMLVWGEMDVESKANELSVKLIELLDFNNLNDLEMTFFDNTRKVCEMIPLFKPEIFKFLLDLKTLDQSLSDNQKNHLDLGIFSIDSKISRNSAILLAQMFDTYEGLVEYVLENNGKEYRFGPLFAITELLKKNNSLLRESPQLYDRLMQQLAIKYDFHRDSALKGEEYILVATQLLIDSNKEILNLDTIFNIIRHNDPGVDRAFKGFLLKLNETMESGLKIEKLNELYFTFIKNGNLNATKNIGYLNFEYLASNGYLELIKSSILDKKVSYDVRVNLLFSLNNILSQNGNSLDFEYLKIIVSQLDDYTLTVHGDVGSKVRMETMVLVEQNVSLFRAEPEFKTLIEAKILRIACEIIDKVKYKAIALFYKLSELSPKETIPITNTDYRTYYDHLFNIFHDIQEKEIRHEFLKGICLTIGSTNKSSTTVSQALNALIAYCDYRLDDSSRNKLYNEIILILKENKEKSLDFNQATWKYFDMDDKFKNSCMIVMLKLLESGQNLITPKNAKTIYIRLYNLEIKTKVNEVLVNVVLVYKYMLLQNYFRKEVSNRYTVMLKKFANKEAVVLKICESLLAVYLQRNDPKNDLIEYLKTRKYSDIMKDVKSGQCFVRTEYM